MEGNLLRIICWAQGYCNASSILENVTEEVLDLARNSNASFRHVKHTANQVANGLAKEGVSH